MSATRRRRTSEVRYSRALLRAEARSRRNEIPPLFEIVPTTRMLALMVATGPLSRSDIVSIRPGVDRRAAIAALKPYIDCGLIVTFRIPELRQQPQIWAINPKHRGAIFFRRALRAVWMHYVKPRLRSRHLSLYRVPTALRVRSSGAPIVYRAPGYRDYGKILHLLAELKAPVHQAALARHLREDSQFTHRVTVLVTLGLVAERYVGRRRLLGLNWSHPVMPSLARWMRWVNRHAGGDVREVAHTLRAQQQLVSGDRSPKQPRQRKPSLRVTIADRSGKRERSFGRS